MDRWTIDSTSEGSFLACIEGALDLSNCQEFLRCLEPLVSGRGNRLEIDLSDVEFIDSSGLHSLLTAHHHGVERGCEMVFVALSPQVERLFELTRCVDLFDIVPVDTSSRAQRGADA